MAASQAAISRGLVALAAGPTSLASAADISGSARSGYRSSDALSCCRRAGRALALDRGSCGPAVRPGNGTQTRCCPALGVAIVARRAPKCRFGFGAICGSASRIIGTVDSQCLLRWTSRPFALDSHPDCRGNDPVWVDFRNFSCPRDALAHTQSAPARIARNPTPALDAVATLIAAARKLGHRPGQVRK